MKSWVEVFPRDSLSGLARVGETGFAPPDDYEFSIAFCSTDGKIAVGKGLVNPWGEAKPVTRAHILAAIKQVKEDTGLDLIYERAKHMAKKKIPHVNDAQSDDDHKAVLGLLAEQHAEGHYGFKDWAQENLGNGEVRISVVRFETNPSEDAA